MSETIQIIPWQSDWEERYHQIETKIQAAIGHQIKSIDHIGSTSVLGLPAKDVIDIQVTVESLAVPIQSALEKLGFIKKEIYDDHRPPGRDDIPEKGLKKHFYSLTQPRVNLHIRVLGEFNQQYAILCRDYLRANPYAAKAYAEIKQQLARYFPDNMDAYYDIKDPVFDILMEGAYLWKKSINL
ncbi:GrpB family protein [Chitinophaga silvatica]|uniref:GrpB family protein n=1 Tax=Chitinophaga silvatica TaxID=2282649 RepID=A0A3E1YEK7_9BACT|nr:GrpB family protein [Chitinophaga silvatica]RFS25002.1 GrpB family protein [Chitinophaga silvatica]